MPVFQVPTNAKVTSQVNLIFIYLSLLLDLFVNSVHSDEFFEKEEVESSQNTWAGLLCHEILPFKERLISRPEMCYTDKNNSRLKYFNSPLCHWLSDIQESLSNS